MNSEYPILVVGGGIAGITATVELAEAGHQVVLIEREPYLGGNVGKLNNYFPKMCPPECGLEINYQRIRSNPRISYYTGAELTSLSGSPGEFSAEISLSARLINNRCTACGNCAEVCPEVRDASGFLSSTLRAAYMPGGLSFPMKYTIDEAFCRKEECGLCLPVCEFDAIHLEARPGTVMLQVHRVILATGWSAYDASRLEGFSYEHPDVVTNLEFDQMLAAENRGLQKLTRISDGEPVKRIAFVQCAGSRDENHLPYCSAVCCSASVKQSLTLAESHPEIETEIFYIDLRLSGRNEMLLDKAVHTGSIRLTKGKVGKVTRDPKTNRLEVEVEDIRLNSKRKENVDLVVLATGLVPNRLSIPVPVDEHGFIQWDGREGIFPAATCKRPMDVSTSVKDATAAALKTIQSG